MRQGVSPITKALIAGFKISGNIKRSEFGLGSYPVAILSDEVINLTLSTQGQYA